MNFIYLERDFNARQHGLFRWTQSYFFMMKIQVDYWAEISSLFISIHFSTPTISTFYPGGTKPGDKRIKAFWTKSFYLSSKGYPFVTARNAQRSLDIAKIKRLESRTTTALDNFIALKEFSHFLRRQIPRRTNRSWKIVSITRWRHNRWLKIKLFKSNKKHLVA